MRLPFFRDKAPAGEPAKPARRATAAASADEGPVQAARVQARRRLIGALVLLAAGVIGFPVLFETTPRPLPVNTPILVPEGTPTRAVTGGAVANVGAPAARPVPTLPPPDAGNEVPAVGAAASVPMPAPPAAAASPAPSTAPVRVAVMTPAPDRGAASSPGLLTPAKPTTPRPEPAKPASAAPLVSPPERVGSSAGPGAAVTGRFVVQVGAYNDVERLKAARQKLEKLGFKTFTQDVETATGKRTRVRLGPFANRAEAEAVATKVKAAGMQANILSL